MSTLSDLKLDLKKKANKNPEQFYAVETLKSKGFHRTQCKSCSKFFWTLTESELCGEPECSGNYTFIGDSPAGVKMDFIETWKAFSKLFKKLGYTPIARYPVVARWRDDVYWNNASIYDFQPHVVSGAVEPPANPLVVPQACVRFNDVDNVGITGRHYTSFVMIGQHAFTPPKDFEREKYFSDIVTWLETGMKLPLHEVKFHEDQWGGGGNIGPCMEFFARGLEVGNQVYMTHAYDDSGIRALDLNVLDMGMGQERPAWLTHGTATSYEANMPTVVSELYKLTSLKPNDDVLTRFLPYSSLLNMDEAEDIEKVWTHIAKQIKLPKEELQNEILPLAALYSIADHTRTLLFAITDGALPSNVGGAYNLRVLLRRAFGFLDTHNWDLDLSKICKTHAQYLKPQFPELLENLETVATILEVEHKKYVSTRDKSKALVQTLIKSKISESKLLELYDSKGIMPEVLQLEARKLGKEIKISEDFYAKVAERHPDVKAKAKKQEFTLTGLKETEPLYYQDTKLFEFDAHVLKKIDSTRVVLDQTAFYPTGGGQQHDTGELNGFKVLNVTKQGPIIIHELEPHTLKEGDHVHGVVNAERRMALARNHDAAHIVGGAARRVLGNHIWQAGSHIEPEKGRLDITHYEGLNSIDLQKIEDLANKVVQESRAITKKPTPRTTAEQAHGFILYQGGYVPGKEIRVVSVADWDVQACGGTHLDNASELGGIKILKTEKIQDGVIRIEFVAGEVLITKRIDLSEELLKESLIELERILSKKKIQEFANPEHLEVAAKVFSVPPKQLPSTFDRFITEIQADAKLLNAKVDFSQATDLIDLSNSLFETWKTQKKHVKVLEEKQFQSYVDSLSKKSSFHFLHVENFGDAMRLVSQFQSKNPDTAYAITAHERAVLSCGKNLKIDAKETLNKLLPNAGITGSAEKAIASAPLKKDHEEQLRELLNA